MVEERLELFGVGIHGVPDCDGVLCDLRVPDFLGEIQEAFKSEDVESQEIVEVVSVGDGPDYEALLYVVAEEVELVVESSDWTTRRRLSTAFRRAVGLTPAHSNKGAKAFLLTLAMPLSSSTGTWNSALACANVVSSAEVPFATGAGDSADCTSLPQPTNSNTVLSRATAVKGRGMLGMAP